MNILNGFLVAVVILVAIVLIVLILMQPSKGGGLGSAFGGMGESVFGAQVMSHLSKMTVVLITAFFVLTLVLAIIGAHMKSSESTAVNKIAEMAESMDVEAAVTEVSEVPVAPADNAEASVPASGLN